MVNDHRTRKDQTRHVGSVSTLGPVSQRPDRPKRPDCRHEIADQIAALPPLTSCYTRIVLTQKLRRIVDEGAGYGLALEGISAADVARRTAAKN
jgi:hypothetical protein